MAKIKIGKWEVEEELDREIEEATQRGEERMRTEPRAESVRYDKKQKRVVIELNNGCTFMFPPTQVQALSEASEKELSDCHVLGVGFAVEWKSLDAQFNIAGLMQGRFGNTAWMEKLRSKNKASTSKPTKNNKPKKQRENEAA